MVIIFIFIFIFISLPWQNNTTALSATFDNSESLKHSRHFETNKLETNCGRQGPALPFRPPHSAGCISTLGKRLDLLLAALKMGKGKRIEACLHCQSEACIQGGFWSGSCFPAQRCLQQQGAAHPELRHTRREGGTGLSPRLVAAVIIILGVQAAPHGCCMLDICFPYSLLQTLPVPCSSLLRARSPACLLPLPSQGLCLPSLSLFPPPCAVIRPQDSALSKGWHVSVGAAGSREISASCLLVFWILSWLLSSV